jgi:primosomal protein N' (replication factor Y)
VRVIASNADRVVANVNDDPALVIATSGCEPYATSGYAAAVALDVDVWLTLPDLRAEQFAFTRLAHAFSLMRPGAPAVLVGDPTSVVAQALIRWDPVGFAHRQLQERESAHLPPAARVITLTGSAADLLDIVPQLNLPQPSQVVGPFEPQDVRRDPGIVNMHVTVPWRFGSQMSQQLRDVLAQRQAVRRGNPVRVRIDAVTGN